MMNRFHYDKSDTTLTKILICCIAAVLAIVFMSSVLVIKGQVVTTDTRLGRVGSTGLSTGPHLHFTVFKNGRTVNPANLWK